MKNIFPGKENGNNRTYAPVRRAMHVLLIALCSVLVSVTSATCFAAAPGIELTELNDQVQEVVQRIEPACVGVTVGQGNRTMGSFSAVIVSEEGHILTAGHCIRQGTNYKVHLPNGKTLSAKSLGRSSILDCGMLIITDEDAEFSSVELGDSAKLASHEPCISIGHPSGYRSQRGSVVRFGRIVGRNSRWHIHNTCLMEPGDSGGGLFDMEGRLIGIHSYISKSLDQNYDIPVNDFRDHWDQLCEPKDFNPSWAVDQFGISLKSSRATKEGVEIASVLEGSLAEKAGLKPGDQITAIGGKKLTDGFFAEKTLEFMSRNRNSDASIEVHREAKKINVVFKKYTPKFPAVSSGVAKRYASLVEPVKLVSDLESKLDDCVVSIKSEREGKELTVLGTVVGRDGLIVTKDSRVDESPKIAIGDQPPIAAVVVSRDTKNDLVLLRVDRQFSSAVETVDSPELRLGTALLAPHPSNETGRVGVLGSKSFASPERKSCGYLGVLPTARDNDVVLKEIVGSPAKNAGLKVDDVILKVDDKQIDSVNKLIKTIGSYAPGTKIRIKIKRGEDQKVIEVTLGKRPAMNGRHAASFFKGGRSDRASGFTEVFCHDAHVEPKECGGPLFDLDGNFIGITIARVSRTHCYALPATIVQQFLNDCEQQDAEPEDSPKES